MDLLPLEIVNIILEFQGYHRYRNGKYITSLHLDEQKYYRLKRKPLIQKYRGIYKTIFQKKNTTYMITTAIYSEKIHWYMDTYKHCVNEKKCIEKNYHYVYEHNDKQHSPLTNYSTTTYSI
jgi:hypothetical protein